MLTNKKISVKNIVAKVYQDLGLKEEIDIGAVIEWAMEALNKINVYQQLETVPECKINIQNYKGELPCDLVYLTSVSYNGHQINFAAGDDIFVKTDKIYYVTPKSINQDKIENTPFYYSKEYPVGKGEVFLVQNGWFKTSFEKGEFNISYKKASFDDEGFLLIPDHESFRDALFWYISYKYFYIKSIQDDKFFKFYQDAEMKYRYYINQAGAEAMMPDQFVMENIKRNYLRYLPKLDTYKVFYSDLNR